MKPTNFVVGIVLGIALAVGIWLAKQMATRTAAPTTATVLPTSTDIPEFALLDQNGEAATQSFFQGQWDLVFFGFTNCPDICPITLQTLSAARKQLAAAESFPLPRIVLVSVDPERDRPDNLAAYLNGFGAGNAGLTGSMEELRKLTGGLGIFFEKRTSDDEYYSVDHSAVVLLINPAGRFSALFSSPHTIENFVHDLPLLMQAPLSASELEISRAIPGNGMRAAYMALTNRAAQEIRITRVSSPQFGSVELHETAVEDGVAKMRSLETLRISRGETVRLAPGGKHLMLSKPTGDSGPISLNFYSDNELMLTLTGSGGKG